MSTTRFLTVCALALGLCVGCQLSRYRITDITTGKEFETRGTLPSLVGRQGQIRFRDAATGDTITLQSYRVHELNEPVGSAGDGR